MNLPENIEELVYRSSLEPYTVDEQQRLDSWLAESEENRKIYRDSLSLWYQGKYAGRWGMISEKEAWEKLERKRLFRLFRRRMWRISAVAAMVTLFIGGGLLYWDFSGRRMIEQQPEAFVIEAGSPKAVLVLSSGQRISLENQAAGYITEEGMEIMRDSSAVVYRGEEIPENELIVYNELIVPEGGEYKLCLSDGSVVYLNSESRLRYPVRFGSGQREVVLEGEAYFEVSADEKRPFMVRTDKLSVKVLGTGFNVMAYRTDPRTEITLLHGSVDVRLGERNTLLEPDQQFVVDNRTLQYQVREVNAAGFVEWKDGLLNFDAIPLEQLAVKLGRWYGVDFFFSSEAVKHLKFSGAFRKYNDINYILNLIEKTTEVTFKINQKTIVVSKR